MSDIVVGLQGTTYHLTVTIDGVAFTVKHQVSVSGKYSHMAINNSTDCSPPTEAEEEAIEHAVNLYHERENNHVSFWRRKTDLTHIGK